MKSDKQNRQKLYCHGCGAAVSEKKLAKGKAVRREGVIYCRKCFRREFPRECRNHPGKPADAPCAMCGVPHCSDCLIEIAGKQVCERCKGSVIGMIEKGGDPLKPGALALSKREYEKKLPRELREIAVRVLPSKFYIPVIITACTTVFMLTYARSYLGFIAMWYVTAPILGIYWFVNSRGQVRLLTVSERGILGETAGRSKLELPWENVSSVAIGKREIVVRGKGPDIRIRKSMFARYHLIADVLREACRQKTITCTG